MNDLTDVFCGFFPKTPHPYLLLPVWQEQYDEYFSPIGTRANETREDDAVRIFSPLAVGKEIPLMSVCQYKTGEVSDGDTPSLAMKLTSVICQILGAYHRFDIKSAEMTDFEFSDRSYQLGLFEKIEAKRHRRLNMSLHKLINPSIVRTSNPDFQISLDVAGAFDLLKGTLKVDVDFKLEFHESVDKQLVDTMNFGFKPVGFEIEAIGRAKGM